MELATLATIDKKENTLKRARLLASPWCIGHPQGLTTLAIFDEIKNIHLREASCL